MQEMKKEPILRVVYPVPEKFPDTKARFIQIIDTCHSLAEKGVQVKIVTAIKKGHTLETVFAHYGLQRHPNLEFVRLPMLRGTGIGFLRGSSHIVFHFFLLAYLVFQLRFNDRTALYVRHLKLANFLLKFKKLLKLFFLFEVHPSEAERVSGKRTKRVVLRILKSSDALICTSEPIRDLISSLGINSKPVHVVENAAKREWFHVERVSENPFICYTGSLHPWKGVDTLIRALQYLPRERLMVVGEGPELENLKALSNALGIAERVEFAGFVPHVSVSGFLARAKILVLPNAADGASRFTSPLKLFEYMACGLPIAASDIPAFRSILVHGKNCLLFEPSNPESLAARITEINENPRLARKLAAAAKEDAEKHTYEKRAEKIIWVIKAAEKPAV